MDIEIDKIVEHLFQNKTLSDISEQEIQELVDTYPYFTPGRFLLAKKLLKDGNTSADDEIATAALYFHNPLWFQWLLSEQKITDDSWEKKHDQLIDRPAELPEKEDETITVTNETAQEDQPLTQAIDENVSVEMKGNETAAEEIGQPDNIQATEEIESRSVAESEPDRFAEVISTTEPQVASSQNEGPVFEPYYTIDYFASQGIKLSQADFTKDKFGQQLKSFTEWLRSMKRLPNTTEIRMDDTAERSIQNIAENSLQEKEVLTEAMAEVWAKQGNAEKAIEIYQKLSLINPDKSAYFAARIEQIKG